jgi:hypothetical protein
MFSDLWFKQYKGFAQFLLLEDRLSLWETEFNLDCLYTVVEVEVGYIFRQISSGFLCES